MKKYFNIFIVLLVAEIAIAIFYFHKFIRGFIGDVLVIPLLFCFLKLFSKASNKKIGSATFDRTVRSEFIYL